MNFLLELTRKLPYVYREAGRALHRTLPSG